MKKTMKQNKGLLTTKDLHRILDVSFPTIYRWRKLKKLTPYARLTNGTMLYLEKDIKELKKILQL